MKDIFKTIAKISFYALCTVLIGWTASLTYAFVSSVMPGKTLEPVMALVVFDAGMLVWLLVFIKYAKGVMQRSIAMIMTLLDLVGVGIMAVAELFLGGQTYAVPIQNLGEMALWVVAAWTFVSVAAVVAFHLTDPKTADDIEHGVMRDRLNEEKNKHINASLEYHGRQLAFEEGEKVKQELLSEWGISDPGRFIDAEYRQHGGEPVKAADTILITPDPTEPRSRATGGSRRGAGTGS